MDEIKYGDVVIVRDGRGQELRKRALGPITRGSYFKVVWACREEEWQAARDRGREPEGMPWPAEDVRKAQD
ncbi:MAG TPA: hypothetical protein VGQ05_00955 [Streptosporangiaceae bacterium]|jgi:hypothetical protein|nr:hypothetical protein [Streptosporangiaceae bacterium]